MSDFVTIEEITPYCQDFTRQQLEQAKDICDTYRLTPVKRQVHFNLRNTKDANGGWTKIVSFMVTVDGLRGIAERGGSYEGQVGPFWCGPDGQWVDVWLQDTPPAAAKIGVYKKNFRDALYAVAKFEEYKQTDKQGNVTGMWVKMPATMIAKCAEALAIRRAFPDEVGGIYTTEEMQQAEKTPDSHVVNEPQITEDDQKLQRDLFYEISIASDDYRCDEIIELADELPDLLKDAVLQQAETRKTQIENGVAVKPAWGFLNVSEATKFAALAKENIDTMPLQELGEWLADNDHKLKAIDYMLKAKKYIVDGKAPYQRLSELYKRRMEQKND